MIKLEAITKKRQNRTILNDLTVEFLDRHHYVILGESGSGKTTLLNLIAGYDTADIGTIETDENSKIEYLFQDSLLFSNITVKENMLIKWTSRNPNAIKEDFEEKSKHALRLFSVEQFYDSKVHSLSGGEKRRVELAQIFLSQPDILLLDEPTANLDSENKKSIIEIIQKNFKNTIVILVSHDSKKYFQNYTFLYLRGGKLNNE